MADDLDTAAAVSAYLGERSNPAQLGAQARYSMSNAVGAKPDFEAELRDVARRTGVPVDTVRAFPDKLKQEAALQRFDFDGLAAQFPSTTRFLAGEENAKIAHDDTENLGALEQTLGFLTRSGKAIVSGAPSAAAGLYGAAAAPFELASQFVTGPLVGTVLPADPAAAAAAGLRDLQAGQKRSAKALMPKTDGVVDAGYYSGLQSLGQNLLTLPLAVLPGGQQAALSGMVAPVFGDASGEARAAGMSPLGSTVFGASQAAIEYATEKLPLSRLVGDLKAGTPFLKTLARNVAAEVPGEQLATVLQDMNEWAALHPEKPFSEYLAERPSAAAQTLIATLVGVGGQVTVLKGVDAAVARIQGRTQAAEQADQSAQAFEQLHQLAAASKVRQRDAQTFEQFIREATADGDVPDVFISADALAQSGVVEQVLAASPAAAEQFQAALATGEDIRIPVPEYATTIAGEEFAQSLVEHLKTDPQGFSQAEAKEFMEQQGAELEAEVGRVLAEQQGDQQFKASRDAVQANLAAQLEQANRFTADVNAPYAGLAANFYAVQAARLGITPQEMFVRYPLRIVAQNPLQGGQLAQDEPQASITGTEFGDEALPVADLRRAARAWYDTNVRGTAVVNAASGREIKFGRGNKAFGSSANPEKVKLFAALPALLERGEIVASEAPADAFAEKNVKAYHWLEGTVSIGGRSVRVGVTIREDDKGNLYYNHNPIKGKGPQPPEARTTPAHKAGGLPSEGETLDQSLAPDVDGLNLAVVNQGTGQRGSFSPSTNTIALLKGADLSTFLHEAGHFFLEVQADLAARPDAPPEIRADMDRLLTWFGVKAEEGADALEVWHRMSLDEKRPHHEQFARGFEAYLFEGNAPGVEMQGVFQRFRAWLLAVYRDLKALNVDLTDDVRRVMDRMLATAEQIQTAEAAASMNMMFKTPEEAAQFGVEWRGYHEQGLQATQDAVAELETRGLRDMQWLANAKARELKKLQKRAEGLRAEVEREARAEVMSQPIYRAWSFLTSKASDQVVPGVTELDDAAAQQLGGKLRTKVLREIYGTEADALWRQLSALGMTSDARGSHPDLVAELFGFSSGDELVRKLVDAEPPEQVIEGLTDQRMLERHGDLSSPEDLQRAADQAVHNDARARFVATELNALQKALDARAAAGTDKKGRQRTVAILPAAARQFAAGIIARLKVRDIRPSQYQAAEARAARAAEKALKAGDVAQAAMEKRNQLVNNFATKAAHEAQAEVEKALRYFDKVERSDSIDVDYRDQIAQLLDRYDLRRQSLRAIDKRKSLAEWVEAQRELGLEPEIPAELLNGLDRKSYKDMTVEDLRGLVDTVKQIEHLGRLKNKLLTAKDQRTYEAIRDEIAASILANGKGRKADTRTPTTNLGRWFQSVKNFGAAHIKAATWARVMDGGKDGGPVWEYLVRGANERGDQETTQRAEATRQLSEIMAPFLKSGKTGGKGTFFPSINRSLNRESVLAIALNTGNQGNLQRLLGGEGWTLDRLVPVLDTLGAEDWATVQRVWDYFESFRPEIAAKERRVYGKEPNWIEPTPVVTKHGTFRGGYYPIKYDPAASVRAEEHADAEEARALLKGAYGAATTRRSFTKSRVDEVSGRPLLYTLAGMYSGVNDVIHDLAWHEWLIDANRLLKSDKIDRAMRGTYGPAAVRQFKSWRDAIAVGDGGTQEAIDSALARLRQGVSVAGLGFNVMSAAMQPLGITQSIVRVGAGWIGRGVAQYVGSPLATTREVNGKSEFMANRMRTRFRELNELRNRVQGQTVLRERIQSTAYVLMMRFQQVVDVPTWLGAYEKAIAAGEAEDRAVDLADQAVIDAQGGGQTKDLSAIERGGAAQKLFTVFYSFMNTALNLGVAQGMTNKSAAKTAADLLLLYSVPAILGSMLKDALTPGDAGDDDLVKKLLAEQLGFLFGLIVVGREFGEAAKTAAGLTDYQRDYAGPAGVRVVSDASNFAKQAAQGEFDDSFRKSAVNLTGSLFGLPAAQINRSVTGAQALAEGETSNPAALVFGFQRER